MLLLAEAARDCTTCGPSALERGLAEPRRESASVVDGMLAGADSIDDDLDPPRHGAMGRLFGAVRAPSTLGTYLRSFTQGQLHLSFDPCDNARMADTATSARGVPVSLHPDRPPPTVWVLHSHNSWNTPRGYASMYEFPVGVAEASWDDHAGQSQSAQGPQPARHGSAAANAGQRYRSRSQTLTEP